MPENNNHKENDEHSVYIPEAEIPPNRYDETYSRILDDWLLASRLKIKESSYTRYCRLADTHIRPQLGSYLLSELTTRVVEEFIARQFTSGRLDHSGGLSNKTVTDILTIIKSTMEYAEYLGFNVSCNLSRLIVKKENKEMRVLTVNEQKSLSNILLTDTDLYKFGVLLSLYTGIRIGELCALQWKNLNLTDSVLKITKTLQRIPNLSSGTAARTKIVITEPKSRHSVREIPMPDFLTDKARQFSGLPEEYVLTGKKGKYVEPRTMQNHFKTYIEESGIKCTNFHALRHTFATRCVEAGFDIKSLSEILGHSNVNITLNRYVHSSLELKRSNMNKLTIIQ